MSSPDVQHPAEITTSRDLLLTGSAIGVVSRLMPDTSWGRFCVNLARRPGVVAHRAGSFGRELGSIATGTSDRAPVKEDKRFSDPAWAGRGGDQKLAPTELGGDGLEVLAPAPGRYVHER
jgi:hypothetical protein